MDSEVARLPAPRPIDIGGSWLGSGKLYCRQSIEKINTTGGTDNRLMLVHGLFLLQGVQVSGGGAIKRMIPLPDLEGIWHDPSSRLTVVKVKAAADPPERDWHFKYISSPGNTHNSMEEVVHVINQCRQSLMPPGTPLLKLHQGMCNINDAKRPGILTAKERLAMYERSPDKLPKRINLPPPKQEQQPRAMPQESLGDPREYWVHLDDPEEDLGFIMQNREGRPVLVTQVSENGPFHRAGIPPGELVSFNNRATPGHSLLKDAVHDTYSKQETRFPVLVRQDFSQATLPPYKPPEPPLPPMQPEVQPREVQESEGLTQSDPDESPDPEEVLAGKLQKAAGLRRKGVISDETYLDTKEHYLTLLGGVPRREVEDELGPDVVPPQSRRPRAPPFPWALVNIGRYIYLREGPSRETRWVVNGGVHGILNALHILDDWCLVRTDNGIEGYLRCKYLDFAPKSELPLRTKKPKDETLRQHLSDIISEPATERPLLGSEFGKHLTTQAPNEFFDPVSGRWLPYSARRAPSQASSWGPTATVQTRSSYQDRDTLYEGSSRGDMQDVRNDELAWLTV